MKVEVLYFEDCPNHAIAVNRVREVLREEGVEAEVVEVNVPDDGGAKEVGFLGSPTVRVNGVDVEPCARSSREYGIMCRTYMVGQKREGAPSKDLLRAALREVLGAHPAAPNSEGAARSRREPRAGYRHPAALIAGSIMAAALASFCCILPIVFALTGLTVVGAATAFAAWRPYLLAATLVLLGLGFYFAYRTPKEECTPGSVCAVPASRRRIRITLWLAAILVLGLAAFPYFSGPVAEFLLSGSTSGSGSPKPATSRFKTASLSIEGMDCSACATAVQNKLNAIRGVRRANVSFERRAAEIEFDPGLASVDQLQKVVEEAGYRVRSKT